MLEKPDVSDEVLINGLLQGYGIAATSIEFLPLGYDASAWVYRVEAADGGAYFLKLRLGAVDAASVLVPRFLVEQGISQVVAPLPTTAGGLWHEAAQFKLILFPLIAGESGMSCGLTEMQWREFGAILRRIHATPLPPELAGCVRRETFIPQWIDLVRQLHAKVRLEEGDDAISAELISFWRARGIVIERIVQRAEELGRRLQASAAEYVLCHSDIHTANLVIDRQNGGLHIVDWDNPLLAPKERDLMFVVADATCALAAPHRDELNFREGYGPGVIDPVALAYYRYEWVVQEIGDFGQRVLRSHHGGDATRLDALQGFVRLFAPEDVVDGALRTEQFL